MCPLTKPKIYVLDMHVGLLLLLLFFQYFLNQEQIKAEGCRINTVKQGKAEGYVQFRKLLFFFFKYVHNYWVAVGEPLSHKMGTGLPLASKND